MAITSLAVFCGSKSGNNPLFENHAKQLGHILAKKNVTLIYGGGNKGIMGAVANAVLEKNGKVTGIIPQLLTDREHSHHGITELIVVENMHVRKKMLYEKCDAAIILPGGFGTLDELFEMLTWNQLSIHSKEIFILNTAGFYNHLLAHAKTMQQENFLYDSIEDRINVINLPQELENYL
ncbi:LOG family protein [Ferruginibacter sp.]|nr:TIGR00730 family Rossman fold protein [Ferruginibacter sp.]